MITETHADDQPRLDSHIEGLGGAFFVFGVAPQRYLIAPQQL